MGIDVAVGEVRVVHAERRFDTVRLTDAERIPYTTGDELVRLLARIASTHPSASIVTALPLAVAAHRMLELPFRDARRLRETVPLELLGQLPGDPGDVAVAFETIGTTVGGATVLAAAVRRSDVSALRATFAGAGCVPERVALAPLPVWNLIDRPDAALVVADGAYSTLSVRRDGRLTGLRALGAAATDVEACVAEIRWALAAMGGAAHLVLAGPDATEDLAASLAVGPGPVVEPIGAVASWHHPALAACALAAGLVAGPGLELDGADGGPEPAGRRRRLVGLAAAAALLVVVDVGVTLGGLARREKLLSDAIRTTAAAALPSGTRLVAPRAQLEAALGGSTAAPARPAAILALLRELSTAVPAGVRLDLGELTLDGDAVRLHGRADGFEAIDLLRRALAATPGLHDVAAEDSRATVDGHGVEFALRATWRPVSGAPS
ncbi:MAG: GspL/Epsl periplasmic domain-containing protein [Candidatus Binatia bacterium]